MSTPGECAWTCDLISKQACPCRPESRRHCASHAPKQASLRPGAGEPAGLPAPVCPCVCISASCLPAARHRCCTTDVTNLLSLCTWLHDSFWMGERAGAGPPVSSVPLRQARWEMNGAAPLPRFVLRQAS